MRLDRHGLAAERVWRQKRWDEALASVERTVTHFLKVDLPQATRYIDYDPERSAGEKTHADAAGEIAQALAQMVSNTYLRTLVSDAAALAEVIVAERDLEALRASLPEPTAKMMTDLEDARLADDLARVLGEQEARAQREAEQCTKPVHSDYSSSRCARKAIGPDGDGNLRCKQHGGVKPKENS